MGLLKIEQAALVICKATIFDAVEIVDTVNVAIKTADYFRKEGCDRLCIKEVEDAILHSSDYTWYLLKEFDSKPAGRVASTILYKSENVRQSSIHLFTTRVDAKGKRYGRTLLEKIEQIAAQEGKSELILWLAAIPKLISYYVKAGFKKTGRKDKYDPAFLKPIYVDQIEIIEMVKELKK